ncbi:MAG: hypothetical protein KJO83_05045 [Bacteroidia bacterium]|nr:hypothetical protein [Bacteroidia bacterium]
MKKITYLLLLLIGSNVAFAQDNVPVLEELNPYRVGLKIGAPIVIGIDLEYVTPLFENRVAPFIDFTSLKYNDDGDIYRSNVFEVGTNVYFDNKGIGEGFYGALSYGHINFKMDRIDYEVDANRQFTGVAKSETKVGTFNVKVGARFGEKFYFRTEIGYGFGSIPESISSTGIMNGAQVTVEEDISEDLRDFPIAGKNGTLLFNIGFGYAFKVK